MCCPSERYALEPGVRLRPVPEMGVCLAYTPARPALHRLNAAAWLVASLCDGRSFAAMATAYREAMGDVGALAASETKLREGIAQLLALGIVRAVPPPPKQGQAGGES